MKTLKNQFVLLTFDVEDWFQVENFKPYIPFSTWPSHELRVEKSTHRLLDLLDSVKSCKATFFALSWVSDRLPWLIREIHARGHEVASHGWKHARCDQQNAGELKKDLEYSKKALEDTIGAPVYGYRAPSFSINEDVLKIIADCGYLYDSSFNSFSAHDRYGIINLADKERKGISTKVSGNFYELPVSNMSIHNKIFPLGGGAYFRLLPSALFKAGARQVMNKDGAFLFYAHPWEMDPDQPKLHEAAAFARFRHYTNQKNTAARLKDLIVSLDGRHFCSCSEYLRVQGAGITTFTRFREERTGDDLPGDLPAAIEHSPPRINILSPTISDSSDGGAAEPPHRELDEITDRGYGLILLRQIMDSVVYIEGVGSDTHNELVMEKRFGNKATGDETREPPVLRLAMGSSFAGINSIRDKFIAPALEVENEQGFPFFAHHLILAITEAFANAVEHGHGFDESKTVWILFEKTASRLVVRITDQGKGFINKQCSTIPIFPPAHAPQYDAVIS